MIGEIIRRALLQILYGKEGDTMMAMLWAQKIILGKKTYAQDPAVCWKSST